MDSSRVVHSYPETFYSVEIEKSTPYMLYCKGARHGICL